MTSPGLFGDEGVFASASVHAEMALLLAREAELLDSRRFQEWVSLVEPTFTYRVPTPVTPDNPFAPHYDPDSLLLDESLDSLTALWFRRFDEDLFRQSWGENPPVRFRHIVSNVRVRERRDDPVLDVRSNVLLVSVRHDDPPVLLSAERFDTAVRRDGGYRLASRYAVLDEVLLSAPQIRVLL
jgi:3-phenylpropionate/trans-cinnamate dioxygenase subunit beta